MAYLGHLLLLGLFLVVSLKESNAQSYKAIVVPYIQISKSVAILIVEENTNKYVNTIQDVKNQADIIIFPENGITSINPVGEIKRHLHLSSVIVPDPGQNVNVNNNVLFKISSAAKLSQIYVVINVLEMDNSTADVKFYSTDVVFDSDGKLAHKCRKKYLYKEHDYTAGNPNQDCTFVAKFKRINADVKFALLFDTDLIVAPEDKFKTVTDAILTSSLQNELPLSFALSLQQGFSVKNQVNLLASGYTDVEYAYGGSGIYLRDGRSKVALSAKLWLVGEVPIDHKKYDKINVKVTSESTVALQNVNYRDLTSTNSSDCELHMEQNLKDIKPYRWISFANATQLLGKNQTVVFCALVKPAPSNNQKIIVNDLHIVARLKTNQILQVLPLSLGTGSDSIMVPANFTFEEKPQDDMTIITIQLSEPKDLVVFGILVTLKSGASICVSHTLFVSLLPLLSILWSKLVV